MNERATFENFEIELRQLVERFEADFEALTSPSYSEARVRSDFLDPLLRALGWDVENRLRLVQGRREVEIESRTDIGGSAKRADYLFRIDGRDRFVCEAKKPREDLGTDHAFQAKRYAWNKGLAFAVLTDFEELKIYIVGSRPRIESPHEGEFRTYHYRQFPAAAHELWSLLARDAVAGGSIERLIETLPKRLSKRAKGSGQWVLRPDRTRALDHDFLEFLDERRRSLASNLLSSNNREVLIQDGRLNDAVQTVLDRILFLRICEDRDTDTGVALVTIVDDWRREKIERADTRQRDLAVRSLWMRLVDHFQGLDGRRTLRVPYFNGNLFKAHFIEDLVVGDDWIAEFIGQLSDGESPYLFSAIPVEILGSVYERFLGKVVRAHGRGAVVEEKPEVRKAGGVYYTPRYVVEYIVDKTLAPLLDSIAAPGEARSSRQFRSFEARSRAIRVLDPACGSGSFLIRVFERLCEHWESRFVAHPEDRRPELCWADQATGDVHLTATLKRRILRENVFGLDIDPQAVEVTQLSLCLKMLEGETRESLNRQRQLFPQRDPLLPALEGNIKCGNSLVAADFSDELDELIRLRAFDWSVQFAFVGNGEGFDAVVGNPPYVRIQGFPSDQVSYFQRTYHAATGSYDLYVNFVERSFALLAPHGRLGMIVPNKFFRTDYGIGLRALLAQAQAVSEIVDFGDSQVFLATTYTCLLFLDRTAKATISVATCTASPTSLLAAVFAERPAASLTAKPWTLADEESLQLIAKANGAGVRLLDLPATMSRGSSTGDDNVFVLDGAAPMVETDLLRVPLFAGDFSRYHFAPTGAWQVLFPYRPGPDGPTLMTLSELKRYPRALGYLSEHATDLRARKQFREWYGFSAARNLAVHERAAIAVPLLADRGLCALIPPGMAGKLCPMASGGFTVALGEDCAYEPEFVLACLNSRLHFWLLRQMSNVFRGGWITCTKQYFGELPIPRLDMNAAHDRDSHDELVQLVRRLTRALDRAHARATGRERSALSNVAEVTERAIDAQVYRLFALTADEIRLVESSP